MTTRDQHPDPADSPPEDPDALVDEWGDGSFPASDPPATVPPTLEENGEERSDEDEGPAKR